MSMLQNAEVNLFIFMNQIKKKYCMYSKVFDYASWHLIKCALFYAINKSNHDSEPLSQT